MRLITILSNLALVSAVAVGPPSPETAQPTVAQPRGFPFSITSIPEGTMVFNGTETPDDIDIATTNDVAADYPVCGTGKFRGLPGVIELLYDNYICYAWDAEITEMKVFIGCTCFAFAQGKGCNPVKGLRAWIVGPKISHLRGKNARYWICGHG